MIHSTILCVTFAFTRRTLHKTLVILELLTVLEDSITRRSVVVTICRIVTLNIICVIVGTVGVVAGAIVVTVVVVVVVLSLPHLLLVLLLLTLKLLLFLDEVRIGVLVKVKIESCPLVEVLICLWDHWVAVVLDLLNFVKMLF